MESGTLKSKVLADGRHLRLVCRNGWEYVERPGVTGIVVVVGLTAHRGLVLVSQWREPVGARVVEFPAGLAGDLPGGAHEDLSAAARRELAEETGFEAVAMDPVLTGPPSPGISSERVTFFRARGLRRTGPGGGVDHEGIRVHVVPLSGMQRWWRRVERQGWMMDPKVWAGVYLLQQEKQEDDHDGKRR